MLVENKEVDFTSFMSPYWNKQTTLAEAVKSHGHTILACTYSCISWASLLVSSPNDTEAYV